MKEYKLDKTAFRMMTFEEADKANVFDKEVSYGERLQEAYYLISQAYNFSIEAPPKLDKNCFSSRNFH